MKILLNDYEFPLTSFNRNMFPTESGMQSTVHIVFDNGIGSLISQLGTLAAGTITDIKIKNSGDTTIYHLDNVSGRMSVNEYLVDETIVVSADITMETVEA